MPNLERGPQKSMLQESTNDRREQSLTRKKFWMLLSAGVTVGVIGFGAAIAALSKDSGCSGESTFSKDLALCETESGAWELDARNSRGHYVVPDLCTPVQITWVDSRSVNYFVREEEHILAIRTLRRDTGEISVTRRLFSPSPPQSC